MEATNVSASESNLAQLLIGADPMTMKLSHAVFSALEDCGLGSYSADSSSMCRCVLKAFKVGYLAAMKACDDLQSRNLPTANVVCAEIWEGDKFVMNVWLEDSPDKEAQAESIATGFMGTYEFTVSGVVRPE